jgi:hypothetical protein
VLATLRVKYLLRRLVQGRRERISCLHPIAFEEQERPVLMHLSPPEAHDVSHAQSHCERKHERRSKVLRQLGEQGSRLLWF